MRPATLALLLLAAAVAAVPLLGTFAPDCLSDDAFISFRYARNLATGHGLVFNAGDPQPVEGYTNFLWTLLLAGTTALGLNPEIAARNLGLMAAMGAQLATFFLARTLMPRFPFLWALPACLLAANSFFVVEAIQGLETTFMAALVTAALARRATEIVAFAAGRKTIPFSALILGLSALTRPEGYLVFAVIILADWLGLARLRRRPGRFQVMSLTLFAVPVVPHLAFRLFTYHDWLPHTFYAKTGGGWDQVLRGLLYVGSGWLHTLPWILLAILALLAPATLRRETPAQRTIVLTGMVWLAATAGVVLEGGDFKPTFRFLVWSLPLVAVLACTGLAVLLAGLSRAKPHRSRMLALSLAAGMLIWAAMGSGQARYFAAQRRMDLKILRQAAAWFDTNLPADALMATGPAGAIPYYTGRPTLDMWGINHAVIGRREMPRMGRGPAGHEKGDGALVLASLPHVILFTEARFSRMPLPENNLASGYLYVSERELLELPGFHDRYRWRSVPLASTMMNFFQRIEGGETDS
ncbi:MAG: hypothetical protein O7D35_04485 [Acidobacteria bacterium]|nr:hypothetical protein [Acidobacteriota bacterium]